jgi:hypothetical protein
VILANNIDELLEVKGKIRLFLDDRLKLNLHPNKIIIRKLNQGIDFLGYVILPHYRTLRTKTKKRMLKRINIKNKASYLGLLKHCNGFRIAQSLNKRYSKNE